jgi:hypothetical protein
MRWKENYPGTIFLKNDPSPVVAMLLGRTILTKNRTGKTFLPPIYIVKHAYNGTIGDRNFSVAGRFRFMQVLAVWITGTRSPRDYKYFPLSSGFRYVQILFKKGSYLWVCVCVCRPIHSQSWSVVLNYVKALHCPVHLQECGWTGPPVRVNGTIIAASNSWKTEIWFCKYRPLTSTPEHFLPLPLHNWKFYSSWQQGISNDTEQRISCISSSLQIIMNPGSRTLYGRINKICLPLSLRICHLVRTAKKSDFCGQKIYVRSFSGKFT